MSRNGRFGDETGEDEAPLDEHLEVLDAYLMSEHSPAESMLLCDLDGFLTALVVGPEPTPTGEWMDVVWGGETPQFADEVEREAVIGALAQRLAEIEREVAAGAPQPVFDTAVDGEAIATDWAFGFVRAIQMRPEAWAPLAESAQHSALMLPFLLLTADDETVLAEMGGELSDEDHGALVEMIPSCVLDIDAFWRRWRRRAASRERR
jgi:uncharacterized protein